MNKPEMKSGVMSQQQQAAAKKVNKEEAQKELRKRHERDSEKVRGVFKNLENPARNGSQGRAVFSIKLYQNDDFVTYELFDGEKYCIPRGVARHLNNNCYYKEYEQLAGDPGVQMSPNGIRHSRSQADGLLRQMGAGQVAKKVHRYAFHSLEYSEDDLDMYPTNLVEVTLNPLG